MGVNSPFQGYFTPTFNHLNNQSRRHPENDGQTVMSLKSKINAAKESGVTPFTSFDEIEAGFN